METVTARMRRTTAISPIRRNGSARISLSRTMVVIVPSSLERPDLGYFEEALRRRVEDKAYGAK
jgi:hypothetical protein